MFKIIREGEQVANEALDVKTYTNKFGTKRIRVVSDNPDPKAAENETFKVKPLADKYGARWDNWDRCLYWNVQFQDEQQLLRKVEDFIRQANIVLGQKSSERTPITSMGQIQTYDDAAKVKEYLVMLKGTLETIKSVGGKVTFEIMDSYINSLAEKVEDPKLLDDIAEFAAASRKFVLETGAYSYSPRNQFLIWLQRTKGATEFGSQQYWYGRGYQPIEKARKIFILSGSSTPFYVTIKKIIEDFPNAPAEFMKSIGGKVQTGKYPIPKEKLQAFFAWAKKNGMTGKTKGIGGEVPIYDNLNVEPIKGREQLNPPEEPDWYGKDTPEDEKAQVMIEALEDFSKKNKIRVTQSPEELGGARGSSSYQHIKLLTSDPTVSLLSTFVHEMAHSLIHQEPMKDVPGSAQGKFYDPSATYSRDERELHAESVAFSVLTTFGFPVSHSATYLALWKADKKKIATYQKLIRDVAMYIIGVIDKYATGKLETMPEVEPEMEPEGGQELQESIIRIKEIMKA